MNGRTLAFAALLATGLGIGGCTTGPTYPLMTPIQVAHDFGYAEMTLPDGRWDVTYVAPVREGYGSYYTRPPAEQENRTLAFDLAIWRASQIAQANGFSGFTVNDTKTNADVSQQSGYYYGPGYYWGSGGWGPGWWGPGWGPGPYPRRWAPIDDYYEPPRSAIQVQVKLTVTLKNQLRPGDYNAGDAIAQLRKTYPAAEGAVQPPQPASATSVQPVSSAQPWQAASPKS